MGSVYSIINPRGTRLTLHVNRCGMAPLHSKQIKILPKKREGEKKKRGRNKSRPVSLDVFCLLPVLVRVSHTQTDFLKTTNHRLLLGSVWLPRLHLPASLAPILPVLSCLSETSAGCGPVDTARLRQSALSASLPACN